MKRKKRILKIAIAGLGVVGAKTLQELLANAARHASRADGTALKVVAVSARDRSKDRGVNLEEAGIQWHDDAVAMAREADVDVVVELIGGSDGVAKDVVEAAIAAGKHVVTANKALLAYHGMNLARAAEARGTTIAFEAAVAGGIPVIELLRQGLAANRISQIGGILNGTTNYILWLMSTTGCTFAHALSEAQRLGYAEADPTSDIDGHDARYKLALLVSLAFGVPVDFAAVHVEGIRDVSALDIQWARKLGMVVKLLGLARLTEQGLESHVYPCLVPADVILAKVDGPTNAVSVTGDPVRTQVYLGDGAGAGPTASAVIADLIDLATGRRIPAFGVPVDELSAVKRVSIAQRVGQYYLRLQVVDQPRVLGDVLTLLGMQGISVASQEQPPKQEVAADGSVSVFITTHATSEAAMQRALRTIRELPSVVEKPCLIRIELGV